MEALICQNSIRIFNSRLPASTILFNFPSISGKIRNSLHLLPRKCHRSLRNASFSCFAAVSASNSTNYNGWDDLRLFRDWEQAGELQQFRSFLISIGIDDRKYASMFLLGFFCALVIYRVRISSIIAFPASVIVFGVGILFGFVRGRCMSSVRASQTKRTSRDDNFRVCTEKLRNLVDFFNGLEGMVSDLGNSIEKAIDCNQITVTDLDSFVKGLESFRLYALSARKLLEDSIDGMGLSGNVVESNGVLDENAKPNRRRKEIDSSGFDFLRFVGFLFGENSLGLKSNKVKDIVGQESLQTSVSNNKGTANAPSAKESVSNLVSESKINDILDFSQNTSDEPAVDQDVEKKLGDSARRIAIVPENGEMDVAETIGGATRPLDNERYIFQNNRSLFMKDHLISLNSVDFSVSMKRTKMEASFGQEQVLKNSNGSCTPHHIKEESETENHRTSLRQERVNYVDGCHLSNKKSMDDSELGSSSSSMVLDDVIFDRCLSEANNHLKDARECLRIGRVDERHAEILLHKSSNLLSKAVRMKPMSLLAVGQLGNTYLLLGELKLKISRELRSQLSRSNPSFSEKWGLKERDDQVYGRDKIASALVSVCEECEELLVEAGRKYRMALSIDGNDMRALYNWGLALSFRAQLIADIGPEGAFDADKVFLAAIDKFDAMMSKSNIYAPDAFFRWGVALQQRSRLRPQSSKEKVKLLQQAKRLYEDALQMDSGKLQLREALSSCISELNF